MVEFVVSVWNRNDKSEESMIIISFKCLIETTNLWFLIIAKLKHCTAIETINNKQTAIRTPYCSLVEHIYTSFGVTKLNQFYYFTFFVQIKSKIKRKKSKCRPENFICYMIKRSRALKTNEYTTNNIVVNEKSDKQNQNQIKTQKKKETFMY